MRPTFSHPAAGVDAALSCAAAAADPVGWMAARPPVWWVATAAPSAALRVGFTPVTVWALRNAAREELLRIDSDEKLRGDTRRRILMRGRAVRGLDELRREGGFSGRTAHATPTAQCSHHFLCFSEWRSFAGAVAGALCGEGCAWVADLGCPDPTTGLAAAAAMC
eukprot:gene10697-24512_t